MTEFAWVIELGSSAASAPLYWDGDEYRYARSGWTADHLEAVRFARRLDAEHVADGYLRNLAVRVCEHAWG